MDTDLISARDAARMLDISLDTLRRWDSAGKIVTVRDDANRRMVPRSEVRRIAAARTESAMPHTGSARNRIECMVTGIEIDGFLARVELESTDPARLVAVITAESVSELGLTEGGRATAVVKATSMMVDVPPK